MDWGSRQAPGSSQVTLQWFSLASGTAPNLETLVMKDLQIALDNAAVKTAAFCLTNRLLL